MTNVCKVHGTTSECVSSQLAKLKIAIALVVIRNKPTGQNAKDFVRNLVFFHHDTEERWKAEYHRLKQEVLQLRQQQLLLSINNSFIAQSSSSSSSNDNVRIPHFQHSQMILTPPNSQLDSQQLCTTLSRSLSTTSSPEDEAEDGERMDFLRAYFYLEHQLRLDRLPSTSNEFVEKDVVQQSVISVLQHVDRSTPKERSDFPKCLDSFRVCVQLLDRHNKWSPPIRDKLMQLSSSWLQRLAEDDCVVKYYALLEILAAADGMAAQLAGILVKLIVESQQRINEWEWDGAELIPRPVMSHFSIASYYFLLLEKTIPRMAPADKSRFVTVLSHVENRVHLNFPLFAASMMRLAHQLAS